MKINVTENKVSIKEEQILNENEYNIHKIQFDFSSEYTDDLVKVALFSIDNHTYKKIISNNECDIPPEVLTQRGYSILGVYAYKTEQDTLVLRYSPSPTKISVYDGSYKADAENSEPITPSEIEQYQQILQNSLQQFQNQYNALVEETEGDIQAIEDELQRKVDEGYFDGEDGFSPIAKVIQKSNGATIEIEDKNGKTTADVLNGEDGYTPVRGVDYWTEEDKQEVEEEATQQIEGKIEEYNDNAAEKLSQYNQNSVQKTNDYNTNAEQKMSTYNTNATEKLSTYNSNATEKFNSYNSNAEQKETNYNTNASQKVETFNTNANSKLSEYNSNAETKKSAYDENATQKTEDFDEHTEEIQDNIEKLQTENARLKATLPTTTGEGQDVTLNKTAEMEFVKPPLPMGNSEQESTEGKQLLPYPYVNTTKTENGITFTDNGDGSITINGTAGTGGASFFLIGGYSATNNMPETLKTILSIQATGQPDVVIQSSFTESEYNVFANNQVINKDWSNVTGGYIRILVRDGVSTNNLKVKPYFVKGTYTAQTFPEYEKYTGGTASPNPDYPQEITNVTGDVEVVVENKNLFDKDNVINAYLNADGTTTSNNTFRVSDYINIKGLDNITISGNYGGSELCCFYDKNKEFISSFGMGSLTTRVVSVPANAEYVRVTVRQDVLNKYQLEKGSTSTPYIPHKEQTFPLTLGNIELCKIGDYQDYFYKESNKWYLHKEIGKVTLDGSENNWSKSGNTTFDRFILGTNIGGIVAQGGYSNYFKVATINVSTILHEMSNNGNSQLVFNYSIYGNTTLEQFKTWLSTHNTTVYYALATPTDTEITDTTLISQLEAINNAISYEEQTNISSNTIALFNVEAYQDAKVILAEKGTYSKPSTGIPKTDLASAVQISLNKADTAIQSHQDISGKQDITDNNLTTTNKTITSAINEVDSIAKGANQALSYGNYSTMITAFNSLANNVYNVGQNVMIITLQVPDLWISGIESTSQTYTYTTDEAFTTELNTNGYVQVGYYKLSALETQKVDLTNYVTNTDYATAEKGGTIRTSNASGLGISNGNLYAVTKAYNTYNSASGNMFIGKGTLENVVAGKELDLKQLSTFDRTKTQVLKNINGTLTWVDES